MKRLMLFSYVGFLLWILGTGPAAAQTGPEELMAAIQAGDSAAVASILDAGGEPGRGLYGRTPLLVAMEEEHVGIFRLLLERGADPAGKVRGLAPLIEVAAEVGNPEILEELIARGANLEGRCPQQMSPLMLAIREGKPDAAKVLIEHGADVDAQYGGTFPLMLGVQAGDLASVRHLIEAGADVKLANNRGDTALDRARVLDRNRTAGDDAPYAEIIAALEAAGGG